MNPAQAHVLKIQYFEWYSRHLWKYHRRFVRGTLAERCNRCAVSSLHSGLTNGVCSACAQSKRASPDKNQVQPEVFLIEQLEHELHAFEGRGKRGFDALLLVSGGKDSAIALHKMTTEFPDLRLLALTVDTGFLSPVAVSNTLALMSKFNVFHVLARPDPNVFIKGFRYALTHLGPKGCYGNVDRFDGDLVHDIARHIAATHKIPLLLSGVSRKQVEIIFGIQHFEIPRELEQSPRKDTGGLALTDIYGPKVAEYWWTPELYSKHDVPRVLFPLYAWNFTEDEISRQTIELGLIKPGKESPLVTNNLLLPLMAFVDVAKLGYSSFEEEFSDMIRDGKADYMHWRSIFEMTEYSGRTGWLVKNEVLSTLKRLDLEPQDAGLNAMVS